MPGITTTHFALSSRSWGMPWSDACIMSVNVSAEASNLSSTLTSLSAANATVLIAPANVKMAMNVFRITVSSAHVISAAGSIVREDTFR